MRLLICLSWLLISDVLLAGISPICSIAGPKAKQSENLMSALTLVPTPAFLVLEMEGKAKFVPPTKAYADVLQTSDRSIIINDVEELRFISQTLAHSNILLVLEGKNEWDAEKSRKVLSVAKLLDIKVSMLWLGDKASPKALKDMVVQSGGAAFDTKDLFQRVDRLCRESLAVK
ncbi:MAG: hypothetical protein H7318_10025 [Oligoflexus sp.]|nr:hypothetical protein [Oligoflexus sp.]